MALTPEEQAELDELEKTHGASLDAATSPPPSPDQAVADTLPTTNEADSWIRRPSAPGKGDRTVVYEPPLQFVQKALAENPDRAAALLPDTYIPEQGLTLSPEAIAGLTKDSPLYQAYANDLWEQAATKATKEGKTAYRYSRAPIFQGGAAGLGPLDTLGMKMDGLAGDILSSAESVVLGADTTMTLGLGGRLIDANARQAANAGNVAQAASVGSQMEPLAALSGPLDRLIGPDIKRSAANEPSTETVGQGDTSREQIMAEHPWLSGGGAVLGALNPIGATGAIYGGAARLARPLAGAAPGVLRSALVSGAAAGGAGLAEQGGREVVGAGMNAARDGKAPEFEPGASDRMKIAAALGLGTGVAADVGGAAMNGTSQWITSPGGLLSGLPEEFERAGGTLTSSGPKAPAELDEVVERARARGDTSVDTHALDLKPTIEASTKANKEATTLQVQKAEHAFFPTREGQQLLPDTEVVGTQLKLLRSQHAESQVIGAGKPAANWTREQFNNELSGVSTAKTEGAHELSVDEAENFLGPTWKRDLLEQTAPKGAKPTSSGAREIDLDAPAAAEDEPFAQTLKRRGVDKVYVSPRRYTAEQHERLIKTYQQLKDSTDPDVRDAQKLYYAALKDRDARPMNGEAGGWSKKQNEHSRLIGAAKDEMSRAAPGGDAFQPLVQYAHVGSGQAEASNALRDAAVRSGSLGQLEQQRVLGMLDRLNEVSNLGGIRQGHLPFSPGRVFQSGALRSVPTLRKYGDAATSPLRGGRGGLAGSMLNLVGTSLDDQPDAIERDAKQ